MTKIFFGECTKCHKDIYVGDIYYYNDSTLGADELLCKDCFPKLIIKLIEDSKFIAEVVDDE